MKEQKFKEEVEKYDELQFNLTRLQKEERDALIMWKQAMESPWISPRFIDGLIFIVSNRI